MDDVLARLERMLRIEVLAADGTGAPDGFALERRLEALEDDLPGALLTLEVTWTGAEVVERGVRISLEMASDDEPPAWLIPGLFYGENRPIGCRRAFPRYERGADDPHGMVSERWSFRTDRAATPAVFAWSAGAMAAIAVDEGSPIGPSGIGFEGSTGRTRIWADLPYREEPIAYRGYETPDVPDVTTHRWQPGETATLTARLVLAGADRHGYVPLLRHLHGRAGAAPDPWVTLEEAAELAADGLLAWHYHPEHRALYETAAFERELDGSAQGEGDRPHMHVGWVSGAPWAAQLVAWGRRIGSEAHASAGADVLDHIAENLSPSGTFWAEWTLEDGWGTGWSPPGTIHANTIGQATLFFLRALVADDGANGSPHPTWEVAARSNLDAITGRQRDDGNLGSYHEALTGEVTEWDGAGALIWIAALLAGAERYDDPIYRRAAVAAGHYYRRFVEAELIYGAPEDVHL